MKILSAKDPAERRVVTFDFSLDLAAGETLTALVSRTVEVVAPGADPSATAMLVSDGEADATGKQWLLPVRAGVDIVDYIIQVVVDTNNSNKRLALACKLPVRKYA